MSAYEDFEAAAAEFYKLTGFLAPGKDQREGPSYEVRCAAWDMWCDWKRDVASLRLRLSRAEQTIELAFAALGFYEASIRANNVADGHEAAYQWRRAQEAVAAARAAREGMK